MLGFVFYSLPFIGCSYPRVLTLEIKVMFKLFDTRYILLDEV